MTVSFSSTQLGSLHHIGIIDCNCHQHPNSGDPVTFHEKELVAGWCQNCNAYMERAVCQRWPISEFDCPHCGARTMVNNIELTTVR